MMAKERVNLTLIKPKLKHSVVLKHFNELGLGEGFIIEDARDPKLLYDKLLDTKGDIFIWEYLERGPKWSVIITKTLEAEKKLHDMSSKKKVKLKKINNFSFVHLKLSEDQVKALNDYL